VIPFDRDASTADALLTDLYLDAILAGRPIRSDVLGEIDGIGASASSVAPSGRLDPAIRAASERLRQDLVRIHPSFRFEERLATRLAEAATALRMPTAVGAEGHLVPFRSRSGRPTAANPGSDGPVIVDGMLGDPSEIDRRDLARPLLIGGALTSAALSLAGAALVAWRRTRPGSPMSRAARAVRTASPAIVRRGALRGPRRSSARPSARGWD
jgi:hypothetical protein